MVELIILALISCLKSFQPTFAVMISTWVSAITHRLWFLTSIIPTPVILPANTPRCLTDMFDLP